MVFVVVVARSRTYQKKIKRNTHIAIDTGGKMRSRQSFKRGFEEGYKAALAEMEKLGLSCCCSGCTKHNFFLIGELDGEIRSVYEQFEEQTKKPHGKGEM